MTTIIIIIGTILTLLGLIGCILPILPGPVLSFVALLLLSFARDWQVFSKDFLLIWAGITVLVTILDYVVPAWGAKKYGASRPGIWGSVIGMIIGIIFFPPFGILGGAFIGAILGEMVNRKKVRDALRAGFGVFIGTVFGIGIKLASAGTMTYYFFKALF